MIRSRPLLRLAAAAVACAVPLTISLPAGTAEASPSHAAQQANGNMVVPGRLSQLPPGGKWVPYIPPNKSLAPSAKTPSTWPTTNGESTPRATPRRAKPLQSELVAPIRRSCPPGTTNYPRPNDAYSCQSIYSDNANVGYPVGLRRGHADPAGFGYLHALVDHGLDEETIAYTIVNNAAGQLQPNGRYLYGLRYEVVGVGIVAVEVYVQKGPGAPTDNYDFGVVTAYCPGYDGPCPAGINESIP